jgi:putative FmdB family regulatory protein
MPVYQYQPLQPIKDCAFCKNGFEVRQHINDEPLAKCPACGTLIKRIISCCNINTRCSEKSLLSDSNLKKHGFTKLVKESKGKYRKIV